MYTYKHNDIIHAFVKDTFKCKNTWDMVYVAFPTSPFLSYNYIIHFILFLRRFESLEFFYTLSKDNLYCGVRKIAIKCLCHGSRFQELASA